MYDFKKLVDIEMMREGLTNNESFINNYDVNKIETTFTMCTERKYIFYIPNEKFSAKIGLISIPKADTIAQQNGGEIRFYLNNELICEIEKEYWDSLELETLIPRLTIRRIIDEKLMNELNIKHEKYIEKNTIHVDMIENEEECEIIREFCQKNKLQYDINYAPLLDKHFAEIHRRRPTGKLMYWEDKFHYDIKIYGNFKLNSYCKECEEYECEECNK